MEWGGSVRREAGRNPRSGIGGPAMGRRRLTLGGFPGVGFCSVGTVILAAMVWQRTMRDSAAMPGAACMTER